MPARLVAIEDGTSILLDKPIMLVGRHPECDIQLQSSKISRRHCCIAQVDQQLVVRDLGSTNGIRINGVPMTEGRLGSADELTIGNLRYKIDWSSMAESPSLAPLPPSQARAKTTAMPDEPVSVDRLESCDMPIPLKEPDSPPLASSRRPAAPAPADASPNGPDPATPEAAPGVDS